MHDRRSGLRGATAYILNAGLMLGFALALGFAFRELDAAVKDLCASLATIATIGG